MTELERITIWKGGVQVPRLLQQPLISSAHNQWKDLRLERHHLASTGESVGTMEGLQICCNLTGPVTVDWLVGGRTVRGLLNSGDLCLGMHGEYRSVAWHEPYDLLLIALSPALLSELAADSGIGRQIELNSLRGFRDQSIEGICRLLLGDTVSGNPAGPGFGEHLACSLAIYLARKFAGVDVPTSPHQRRLPGAILRRVCDLIEARLHTPVGLQDMAREADMSRFYFSRLFRQTTGDSPYRYLLKRRIEKAKTLIGEGRTDSEAANASGFSSPNHLSAAFGRYLGMTPRRFRALHKTRKGTEP